MNTEFRVLPIADIDESPLNHRKHFGDLTELANSIREKGVLQPGLARPMGARYELVYGHRRLRAAEIAGLTEFPVLVRELDDVEVIEAQVVENCQRVDVHPLEEMDGYRRLHEAHGFTVEQIAAKVGKSTTYVYQRLKLRDLGEDARRVFLEGKLTLSTALLVARVANPGLREEAARVVSGEDSGAWPMTTSQAASYIGRKFMLDLSTAKWSLYDEKLVKSAGACSTCPKRSGAQPALFGDVKGDHCTDPECWKAKGAALIQLRLKLAKAAGMRVMTPKKAEEVFLYEWSMHPTPESGFVSLDSTCYEDEQRRTYGEVLGESVKPHTIAERNGDLVEMILRADLPGLLERAGVTTKREERRASPGERQPPPMSPERRAEARVQELIISHAAPFDMKDSMAHMLAHYLSDFYVSDQDALLKSHGLEDDSLESLSSLGVAQLGRLAMQVVALSYLGDLPLDDARLLAMTKAFGIDAQALLEEERAKDADDATTKKKRGQR